MEIKRNFYLDKIKERRWNDSIKVITGMRRSGKSYLLFNIFRNELINEGIRDKDIIEINLERIESAGLRHPIALYEYVKKCCPPNKKKYVFIDEIQYVPEIPNPFVKDGEKLTFYDTLNSFLGMKNIDVYVTGSNSKMLSSDILTQFRGRGDEIRVHPLSFDEFFSAVGGDKREAFERYMRYGGMPEIVGRTEAATEEYLDRLFRETYLRDICERYDIERKDVLDNIVDILCSDVGSLTSIHNIASTIEGRISENTVRKYVDYLMDAFIFSESQRYDVKGRKYISSPMKYYCEDVGLRNSHINFRQVEKTHIMENIVYNELTKRGYRVDVGVVYTNSLNKKKQMVKKIKEIDFVATKGNRKYYVQSAFAMPNEEKEDNELEILKKTEDSFPKIVVRGDINGKTLDDNGILHIGIVDFLLDKELVP